MYKPGELQKRPPVVDVASPSKTTDVVIKKEKIDCENVEVIELTDNGDDAVDPMNMTVYNDVVSNTAKYSSPKNAKKCIQVSSRIYFAIRLMTTKTSMP